MEEENKKTPEDSNIKRSALRTYSDDAAEFVRRKELSLLDIAAMKERARTAKDQYTEPKSFPVKRLIIIMIVLLILGASGYAGYSYYLSRLEENTPVTPNLKSPASILPNQKEEIILANNFEEFEKRFSEIYRGDLRPGDLAYLPIKTGVEPNFKYLNSKEFLELIKTDAPINLTNFLENDFMFGMINLDKNRPLLILEGQRGKYEYVFSGMLQWEKTMLKDLTLLIEQNAFASSTEAVFKDVLIKNHQARTAEINGAPALFYVLLNKRYIIITAGQKDLEEIIHRFELFKFS